MKLLPVLTASILHLSSASANATFVFDAQWTTEITAKQSFAMADEDLAMLQELFGPEDSPESYTKMEECRDLMRAIFLQLQSFVQWTSFQIENFESAAVHLQKRIADASVAMGPCVAQKTFPPQIRFAKHMFRSMEEAAGYLRMYTAASKAHSLIRNVSELNVRLLSLYDINGVPDYQARGYTYKVSRLKGQLQGWQRAFLLEDDVPEEIPYIFGYQAIRAEKYIELLESHVGLQWFE